MNAVLEKHDLEKCGQHFVYDEMLKVRDMTRVALHEIAAACQPGMLEEDAVDMAKDILAKKNMLRGWHDVYVRFGSNTTKTFGADSDPGIRLGNNDIMFIDIGPVFEKWEGDGGETFVFGNDEDMKRCAEDVRKLFHVVRKKWQLEHFSGKDLYNFADVEAKKMGWELNLDLSGHRISDFPHSVIYDGPLAEIDFAPSELLWVLEIHIRHPHKTYGAFFEDMLLGDDHFSGVK